MNHYAVYENPVDYPNKFVVRRWDICPVLLIPQPLEVVSVTEDLQDARNSIPSDKIKIDRCEADDPCIKEVWV